MKRSSTTILPLLPYAKNRPRTPPVATALLAAAIVVIACTPLFAQQPSGIPDAAAPSSAADQTQSSADQAANADQAADADQATNAAARRLRNGFGTLTLGGSLTDITQRLNESPFFAFDEAVDVSTVPLSQNTLVSVTGPDYIEQGFLQFDDDALISVQLILNRRRIDHFSVYTILTEKYGPPTSLTPQRAIWSSNAVQIAIERPLTVTYIDMGYFDSQRQEQQDTEQRLEGGLNDFLQQL